MKKKMRDTERECRSERKRDNWREKEKGIDFRKRKV